MLQMSGHTVVLAMLRQQHRYYTSELAQTHQALSKLYRKLVKIERGLSERDGRELNRKDKKKLQWSRSLTKQAIDRLETRQAFLEDYLQTCAWLMSTEQHAPHPFAASLLWSSHAPPAPYDFPAYASPPFTPSTPWTAGPYRPCFEPQEPQYWDLSMIPEREGANCTPSADSGFHEPPLYPYNISNSSSFDASAHIYSHEVMSASFTSSAAGGSSDVSRSKKSSVSEKDDVPTLVNIEELYTAKPLRRMHSEAAVDHESRLQATKWSGLESHGRAHSTTTIIKPDLGRTVSEGAAHSRRVASSAMAAHSEIGVDDGHEDE